MTLPTRGAQLVGAVALSMAVAGRAPDDERILTRSKGRETVYVSRSLRGFTVRVDERLTDSGSDARMGEAALAELDAQLLAIARRLRDVPLARLRAIPIWLGLDDPVAPCACYHPSPEWLREHGFDPRKAKAVEIAHADAFAAWTHEQPWMVLHELAHGEDDLNLRGGERRAELERLFEKAKASGRYDAVLHWNGGRTRHYALENAGEYFAESSESWLGTNDFFPFVKAELIEHDPEMAAFLEEVWEAPVDSAHPR
jgi:hypothetical protein